VDMRVDEAWEDVLAGRIDHLGPLGSTDMGANLRDDFATAENVSDKIVGGSDDTTVLDEQRHRERLEVRGWDRSVVAAN